MVDARQQTRPLLGLLTFFSLWLLLGASQPVAVPPQTTQPALVRTVDAVEMTVGDLDRSTDFYSRVLSFKKISETEVAGNDYEHLEGVFGLRTRVARMRLGEESIELTEYLIPQGRPVPADSRSSDLWFQHIAMVVSHMDRAYGQLRRNHVRYVSSGPQRLPNSNKEAGGIRAFYFRDSDGHPLELLEFPPGKDAAKWHRQTDTLFLGIDHSAIAAGDTQASLRFYRDLLGMRIVRGSENYGTEQEHLSGVFGARVRITSLRAAEGPGIELLEYLSPQGGRPIRGDEHSNDLVDHQIRLAAENVEDAARRLRAARVGPISSGVVSFPNAELGFHAGLLVRDPDGHAVELVEK